eukprot:CAMPEP_0119172896 /NCGR_PEP_ID=MMETSP1315-20130426/30659_1 /TAXON_ID=676789 /ORGANISM="Prasinoderma singularis, Strain RCC927" /LENGTH=72 /DNA_ID=CAMNT_0007166807 /DNA_START=182 /DNA_END=400 /DNA_ORIENTATION=-
MTFLCTSLMRAGFALSRMPRICAASRRVILSAKPPSKYLLDAGEAAHLAYASPASRSSSTAAATPTPTTSGV